MKQLQAFYTVKVESVPTVTEECIFMLFLHSFCSVQGWLAVDKRMCHSDNCQAAGALPWCVPPAQHRTLLLLLLSFAAELVLGQWRSEGEDRRISGHGLVSVSSYGLQGIKDAPLLTLSIRRGLWKICSL